MIINDVQRLRWQILDQCLRDTEVEYFMGEKTKDNETGRTRSLIDYVNVTLRQYNRHYSCSKRMLQNDVALFQKRGARLEPNFHRGHKRILRLINLNWKNPLLRVGTPQGRELTSLHDLLNGEGDFTVRIRLQPALGEEFLDYIAQDSTLTFHANTTPTLTRILLGYGPQIEVLEPQSLRDEFRQTALSLASMYKKSAQPATEAKHHRGEQLDMFGDLF